MTGSDDAAGLGRTVTIEAWKLACEPGRSRAPDHAISRPGSPPTRTSTGPTCTATASSPSCNGGGMEYEGGTTSARARSARDVPQLVRARGQAGEPGRRLVGRGLDLYNDVGADRHRCRSTSPIRRSSSARATRGCARTPSAPTRAASASSRASPSLIGVGQPQVAHERFYNERNAHGRRRPRDLEALLVAPVRPAELVDAFHRFVYGFADPVARPRPVAPRRSRPTPAATPGRGRSGTRPTSGSATPTTAAPPTSRRARARTTGSTPVSATAARPRRRGTSS